MFFLFVMEILNGLLQLVDEWQLLRPFGMCSISHRVSLYADDLDVFASPEPQDLAVLRLVLELFEESSGLGFNLAKCLMIAIWCSEEQIAS
jgi:hypothetical protein